MTIVTTALSMVSVQSTRPDYAYGGGLGQVPIKSAASYALVRGTLPNTIPKNAVVSSALLVVNVYDGPWTGSVTLTAARHTATYTTSTTWNTKPAATGTASATRSNAATGSNFTIDVTADVQAFISGSATNYGWRISTNSSTLHYIRSQAASAGHPFVQIQYTVPTKVPANLSPSGTVVSVAKPSLTFDVDSDTSAINVQVDPSSNPTSPAFDSGTLASTVGFLDLSTTAYAGLANAATTTWRARAMGPTGWSNWSTWAGFSRQNVGTVTITAPTTTPSDSSPVISWTFSGTQFSWQADLLDSTGKVVATSGRVGGTATSWTPTVGVGGNGATGTARVRVWDSYLRTPGVGVPVYSEATQAFTVTLSAGVTPMTTLVSAVVSPSPGVVLTGTRSAGAPDEVIVYRNGLPVDRFPGTDIFTGTAFTYTDWTAPVGQVATYRLAPVVTGVVASGGPTANATPDCDGVWLVDLDTNQAVVLWGKDTGSWDATDLAFVHQPIGGPPVRRRLKRGTLSGSMSGEVITVGSYTAATTLANLDTFADNDAGNVYQLIAGHLNMPVIVGDILVTPTPESNAAHTWAKASFNFWGRE